MISYYYWPFQSAISIFSTNDLKYHVNKARAIQWAVAASVPLHYAVARDMASSTVLQEKADVQRSKIEWLQRHDQECGGLYGLLPIYVYLFQSAPQTTWTDAVEFSKDVKERSLDGAPRPTRTYGTSFRTSFMFNLTLLQSGALTDCSVTTSTRSQRNASRGS